MKEMAKRMAQSFIYAGLLGVFVATALYVLGIFSFIRPFVVRSARFLCPEMVLGLAEPSSPGAILALLSFVFLTNFIMYGFIGAVAWGSWTWLWLRRRRKHDRRAGPDAHR